jgi:hypothetical protein
MTRYYTVANFMSNFYVIRLRRIHSIMMITLVDNDDNVGGIHSFTYLAVELL